MIEMIEMFCKLKKKIFFLKFSRFYYQFVLTTRTVKASSLFDVSENIFYCWGRLNMT